MQLAAGCVHGVLGPNGSGKSTLLHILTGIMQPNSGSVTIAGKPISDPASRMHIGFAHDDLPMPGALTGSEYIQLHQELRKTKNTHIQDTLCDVLGLNPHLNKLISQYSHGMKRKLQLICALSHQPDLIVLDEPYRGLDPESFVLLRQLITDFSSAGSAVLIATHDMLRAELDCDSVSIVSNGKLIQEGTVDEILAAVKATSLEDAFMRLTGKEDLLAAKKLQIQEMIGK